MGKGGSRVLRVISGAVLLFVVVWFLCVGVLANHATRKLQRFAVSSTGRHHFHEGLDLNYVSKRRVPNGPDPIHNR
ncbi:unnamed protein product [Linum trigynum]|uniref:Uncharacterized protein n=1 Tax=Linum trigynum TaxID=586398 RepID=A0AAV2CQC2_9ROSI